MVHNDGQCAHINVTCALSNSTSSRYVNPENDSDERRFVCGLKRRWRGFRHLEMDARETAPRKGSN